MAGIIFAKNSGVNDDMWKEQDRVIRSWMMDADAEKNNDDELVDALTTKVDSKSFGEKFGSTTEFGNFEIVPEGEKAVQDELQAGPSKLIEHDQMIKGFTCTAEMYEDNKLNEMKRMSQQFIRAYKRSRAQQVTDFLTAEGSTYTFGGKTLDRTSADGKAVFAQDHPGVKPGVATQSNVFTNELGNNADMLYTLANRGRNFRNGSGNVMGYTFDTIVLPGNAPKEEDLIKRIIGSEKVVGSGNNDINTQKGGWKLVVNHRWQKTTTKTPFILLSSEMMKDFDALIHMDRIPLTIKDWVDEGTFNLNWSGRYRFSVGCPIWQCAILSGAQSGTTLS